MDGIQNIGGLSPTATAPAAAKPAPAATAVSPPPAAQPDAPRVVLSPPEAAFDSKELRARLQEAVDELNEQMSRTGRDLRFGIDDRIGRNIVTVTSASTGKVVRQIPDEVVLRVAHNIEDLKGVLYDRSL